MISLLYDFKTGDRLIICIMKIQSMLFALVFQDSLNVFNMHSDSALSNKCKAHKSHLHFLP